MALYYSLFIEQCMLVHASYMVRELVSFEYKKHDSLRVIKNCLR